MEGELVIREAVLGDAAALAECHVACWRETYAALLSHGFLGALSAGTFRDRWQRHLSGAGGGPVVVAARGAAVVGFACSGPTRDSPPVPAVELMALYTRAAHHGQGLGQALLDAVIADEPCSLWVARDNAGARAFYTRNGFRPDGRRKVDATLEDLVEVRLVR